MGYLYVWKHSGGGRHIDANWSLTFEDLCETKVWLILILMITKQGLELMTTF